MLITVTAMLTGAPQNARFGRVSFYIFQSYIFCPEGNTSIYALFR